MSKIILDEKWRRIVESFDGSKERMLKETAKILRCFEISKQCEKGITKIYYGQDLECRRKTKYTQFIFIFPIKIVSPDLTV